MKIFKAPSLLIGSTIVSIIISITSVNSYSAVSPDNLTHEKMLDNGLKVIVREDHRSPVIISQIWYKVGSSYESNGYTGLSHMLEHMMFKASKNLKDGEFTKIIAEKGGQQNAFTSNDYTGYYQLLSNVHLETSFKLEAERMQNLSLDSAVLEKERQVVIEERRMRTDDDPISNTYERFLAAAHISSPYHQPVIGWPDDLKNMNIKDLTDWYNTFYAPNNATVVVVGDINADDVFALANKYFGGLQKKDIPASKPRNEMVPIGERQITVNIPAKLPYLIIAYNVPSFRTAENKQDVYALEVINSILTGGNSARLNKKLEREQEIVTSVDSSYDSFNLYDGLFTISAIPSRGKTIANLKVAIIKQLEELKSSTVTAQELERVKANLIAGKVYEQDSISQQASAIGVLESINLSWRDYETYIEALKQVTPEQIKLTAQKYFTENRLTSATLQPKDIQLAKD